MSDRPARPRVLTTAAGTRPEAFGATEWALAGATGVIWGSSFLFIAVAVETLEPVGVAFLRLFLGTATIALVPAARRRVDRSDLPRIVVVAVVWMAVPFTLLGFAEQWIASAVAGMIVGGMPVVTALFAWWLLRIPPSRRVVAGIVVGFAGVAAISLPSATDGESRALGIALVLIVVLCYGTAINLAVPLQQRYGSLTTTLWAQAFATVGVAPFAAARLGASEWELAGLLAVLPLGVLSTGVAPVAFTTLVGRAGATRGSVAIYLLPVVALSLGVLARGESVHPVAAAGAVLVIGGAWLSGSGREPASGPAASATPPTETSRF